MSVPNTKILCQVVSEKSLTEKKVYKQTKIVTEKAKTIYPLYTSYAGGIKSETLLSFSNVCFREIVYKISGSFQYVPLYEIGNTMNKQTSLTFVVSLYFYYHRYLLRT